MKNSLLFLLLLALFCTAQKKQRGSMPGRYDFEPAELYSLLSPSEKVFLQDFGFFAKRAPYKKYCDLYESLKSNGLPIYVTTDCVLHTYHILYDYSLRVLEIEYLHHQVGELTDQMIEQTKELIRKNHGPIKQALVDNLAYFEVAANLLTPDFLPSKSVENRVSAELELINATEGIAMSPIFGYEEDYTQYKPRGHYTRNETLKRYFRAMMWYGRISFRLSPDTTQVNKKGKEETRRALCILEAAKNHRESWSKINDPIILYVGKSDDFTLVEYLGIKDEVFPDLDPIEIAADDAKLVKFIETAMKHRSPKILSTKILDIEDRQIVTKGFRFFGQKFILDSYIFQNLVYDDVGTRQNPRHLPKGLDVFAVLGSDRARDILINIYKENRFLNYESQLEKLTAEFADLKEEDWSFNLYYGWLYTLKSLLLPLPQFLPAYQDKLLQTALGSWAELRHDTILYAKQSYTEMITAIPPQPEVVKGYVEPIPACFARLRKLVDMSERELSKSGYLEQGVKQKFKQFSDLLTRLKSIAEDELANRESSEEDYYVIWNIGKTLGNIETLPGADYTTETDESAALIADVHTDPWNELSLEIGNDVPALIYTTVRTDGKIQIYVGGMYDYYEFAVPIGERLTDEEWQSLSPKPTKPEWIESFVK